MFTGIVEEMGAVSAMEKTLAGTRLTIMASTVMSDLKLGDSVSVNGTCLTVVTKDERNFSVEVSPETLSVTTLGQLTAGVIAHVARRRANQALVTVLRRKLAHVEARIG